MKKEKILRKTTYCQKPAIYEICCDLCRGVDITWSEYEGLIWCFACEEDTKGTGGIFDGPIPIELCTMMGISFDKIRISDGKLLKMKIEDSKIIYVES